MKNRKRIITTLIGMTLTAQLSPVAYTVVNAQEPVAQGQQQVEKNGLADTKIILGGNGCWENENAGIHKVEIKFNTKTMELETNALSGYEGSDHSFHEWCPGEYIVVELISGTTGQIKKHVEMSGKDNIQKLTKALNGTKFAYKDSLKIYHGEGMKRTIIEGNVFDDKGEDISNYATIGVSTEDLNNFQFKITRDGLKRVVQNVKEVGSTDELIKELIHLNKCKHEETIKLTKNIKFDGDAINELLDLSDKKELLIPEGTTLIGSNENIEIDLGKQASLVLKGSYTGLRNITIKNSDKDGVQVYNSDYSSLKNVTVKGCKGYGIFANGSTVTMQDCKTSENKQGGVLVSKSVDLDLRGKQNTNVIFKMNTNQFNEEHKVVVKNLKLKENGKMFREINKNTFKVEFGKMGNDKGPDAYSPGKETKITGLNNIYREILEQKYPSKNFDNIKVEEDYEYYDLNKL